MISPQVRRVSLVPSAALGLSFLVACAESLPSEDGDEPSNEEHASTGEDESMDASELPPGWSTWVSPAGDNSVGSVRMLDGQRGFVTAYGSAASPDLAGLYRTGDGGVGFEPLDLGFDALDVAWIGEAQTLWVVGSGSPPVRRSTDGGQSFHPLGADISDFLGLVAFFDERDGVAASEAGDRVWVTHDGGESWERFEFGRELVPGVNRIVLHGDRVFFVSGPDYDADGTGGTLVHSPDRGRSWNAPIVFEDRAHDRAGGGLSGLAVIDEHEVWVAGRNRQIHRTTDGMRTWEQITTVPATISHVLAIERFADRIVAVGLGAPNEARLFVSVDEGATWSLGEPIVAAAEFRHATFVPDGKLVLYGLDGVILVGAWQ